MSLPYSAKAYSSLKMFYFPDKLNSLLTVEITSPIHIRIKPTNICNHKCYYCSYRVDKIQLGKHMKMDSIPKDKMIEICEDIETMGVRAVTFSGGGEPLCYPHINEFIQRLVNVRLAMLTNGELLKGEKARLIAQRFDWIRVSLDGWDNQSYCKYRGLQGDKFDNLIDNLSKFKELGDCCVSINIVIDRDNHNHIDKIIERVYNVGIDNLKFSPVITHTDTKVVYEYHKPIIKQTSSMIKRIMDKYASSFEIYDSYEAELNDFSQGHTQYKWCPYCQITTVIGADCRMYYCHDKAYNLDCGVLEDLNYIRLKYAWKRGKQKFFKIIPSIDCRHHCIANRLNTQIINFTENTKHKEFI